MEIEISGEQAKLLWQKAVWLPHYKTLLAADLHFGKINHFRRAGIPVPPKANDRNTETLIDVLNETGAERVIFLGDLFHSHYNEEWSVVGQVLRLAPRRVHQEASVETHDRRGLGLFSRLHHRLKRL